MFFTTLIFAGSNKRIHHHQLNSTPATLECTQHATFTSTGSYTYDGIPYTVSVSASASASNENCSTASSEATALSMIYSQNALQTSLRALQTSCAGVM